MKKQFNPKTAISAAVATALVLASGATFAQVVPGEIDLTAITGAFSASAVIVAVLAVAGVLATIYATMTAAKMALRWIRGG